ncbi:cupin domain-containing protein [Echinimonas agarilytica]|nr:cupin domain-containing protein [Echinimonas agarilytica]
MTQSTNAAQIIEALKLEAHVEGGYFRRTYQSDQRPTVDTDHGERFLLTSIFYMMTDDSPIGHFHKNRSDILHFYHSGDPIRYVLLWPDGRREQFILGHDVVAGQQMQLTVPAGVWKSSELLTAEHGYGLISEAVSPGFDFDDMTLAETTSLVAQYPEYAEEIDRLSYRSLEGASDSN